MGDAVGGLTLEGVPPRRATRRTPSRRIPHRRPTHRRWRFWRSPPDQPALGQAVSPARRRTGRALLRLGHEQRHARDVLRRCGAQHVARAGTTSSSAPSTPGARVTSTSSPVPSGSRRCRVRVFGFHAWAIVLPQVVEGTLTVLVLFRAVRRVGGPRRRAGRGRRPGRHPGHHPARPGQHLGLPADPAAGAGGRRHDGGVHDGPPVAPRSSPASGSVWPSRPRCSRRGSCSPRSTSPTCSPRPSPSWPGASVTSRSSASCVVRGLAVAACRSSPSCRRTTGPTSTAAATTRSFSQVFLYNGADRLTGDTLDQPGCNPAPAPVAGGTRWHLAPRWPCHRGPAASSTASSAGTATGCCCPPPSPW